MRSMACPAARCLRRSRHHCRHICGRLHDRYPSARPSFALPRSPGSALPLRERPLLVTTDGEFHVTRRQLDRTEEEGAEVVRGGGFVRFPNKVGVDGQGDSGRRGRGGFLTMEVHAAGEICCKPRGRGVYRDRRSRVLRLGPALYVTGRQLEGGRRAGGGGGGLGHGGVWVSRCNIFGVPGHLLM